MSTIPSLATIANEPVQVEIQGRTYSFSKMTHRDLLHFQRLCNEQGVDPFPYVPPRLLEATIDELNDDDRKLAMSLGYQSTQRKFAAVTVAFQRSNAAMSFDDVCDLFELDNPEHDELLDQLWNITQTGEANPEPVEDEGDEGNEAAAVTVE
jgi:hypothetical protein